MKLLGRISIFLLSAAIFMSAFVVFAENPEGQLPAWPYLQFNITLSDQNRIRENSEEALNAEIAGAVSAPFFALTRDYPDLTMWSTGFNLRSSCSVITSGTKKTYILTAVEYTLNGNQNYGDPSGMLGQLRKIVDGFTPSGDTMYDKLKSIHDFICETNTYVSGSPYCYSAYGALVDKKSVCEGYAEAFKLLCDKVGIDCIVVTGMSLPDSDNTLEAHMWNLVRMDDGEWYAVDVTWDDAGDISGNYKYFLVGSDTVVRGRKFDESHLVSYDFIHIDGEEKTLSELEYPALSSVSYDVENGKTEYVYGGERFHYNFLNDLQKEIYDKILTQLQNNMPSDPSKTPNYDTTDGTVTTPEETTTKPEDTTPEDTTTEDTTTEDITTTVETTTPEEETTPMETTDVSTDTTEEATDTEPSNTTPSDTTPSDTTEPPVSSTQKETEPPVSNTTQKPDTTEKDTQGDTTGKPETTVNTTTVGQDMTPREREMYDLYKALTTIVIVCAISSLSIILGVIIIRYAKKHKN